ncbi:MAG TPA: ComEA family DNA-binding protein [Dehalococcoidia bacterium]|nr:ComEA family DNA-binding protein [Dehalococcoidia bacterium]
MTELIERYRWLVVCALAAPFLVAIGYLIADRTADSQPLVLDLSPAQVRVYVIGEVARPGVYTLPSDARWIDALEAAGGATANADLFRVNLARHARDEDQVIVPRLGDSGAPATASGNSRLININSASAAELDTLPGIGEVRSQRIVESRTTRGAFASTQELVSRELVPQSVYNDIKDLITVGP